MRWKARVPGPAFALPARVLLLILKLKRLFLTPQPFRMKKTFILSLLLAAGLPALAQIQKGNVMLGGSLYGSWNRSESNDSRMFPARSWGGNVSPSVGYFVVKGLSLGIVTGYDRSWSRQRYPQTLTSGARAEGSFRSSSFSLGPEVHYYVMLGEKLALYAQTLLS